MATRVERTRRITRSALAALIITTLSVGGVGPLGAQEDSDIVVDGSRATVTVVAAGPISLGDAGPGVQPYWPYACAWDEVWANSEVIIAQTDTPTPGQRYWLRCEPDADSGLDPIGEFVVYDPLDPIPGFAAITSIEIRDFARDFVQPNPLPVGISPDGVQITGVETWFWPDGSLASVQASANANGLSVTVEARYRGTTYDLGEPGTAPLTCTTKDVWVPGAQHTTCAHTYLSEDERRVVESTSEWDFVWWDNAAQPVPALFETVFLAEALDIEVIDLEAVITNPG